MFSITLFSGMIIALLLLWVFILKRENRILEDELATVIGEKNKLRRELLHAQISNKNLWEESVFGKSPKSTPPILPECFTCD